MTYWEAVKYSGPHGDDTGNFISRHEAALLLSHITGASLTEIAVNPDRMLTQEEEIHYLHVINERHKRVPLQYILGKWQFMGLDFIVTPNVLIPRQDTELLVETAIKAYNEIKQAEGHILEDRRKDSALRVLDLCTGSGCIGITLAKLAGAEVTVSDISASALEIAEQNARLNGVSDRIRFVLSDLFNNIPNEQFHLVISNPPYIPSEEIAALQPEVRDYEPLSALDGGADGLDFYRKIIPRAHEYMTPGGILLLEIGVGPGVRELLTRHGYKDIVTLNDLAGLERAVLARYTPISTEETHV